MKHCVSTFEGGAKNRLVETCKARPFFVVCLIWTTIYLPLVIGLGIYAPERTFTVHIDTSDVTSVSIEHITYEKNNVTLSVCGDENEQIVLVSVPEDYVPEIVKLEGYGKLYTNVAYSTNRSWVIPPRALPFTEQELAMWSVKVSGRTDVMIYRDRGTTTLEGGLLYRDVHTETPPLISLIWVVPVLFGGSMAIFRIYFALFALGAACIIVKTHQSSVGTAGCYAALFLLLNPLTLYTTLIELEDEIVVVLLFALIIMFYYRNKLQRVAASIGLGMAFKMWPVLIIPGLLKERVRFSKKLQYLLITMGVFGVCLFPFLLVAPEQVMLFMRLYLTGNSGAEIQGISVWKFLGEVGFPTWLMLPMLVVCSIMLFMIIKREHVDGILIGMLFVILFLLLFPKIHVGYHLYILPFLPFVWGMRHIKGVTLLMGTGVIALSLSRKIGLDNDILLVFSLIVAGFITALVGMMFIGVSHNVIKKDAKNYMTL